MRRENTNTVGLKTLPKSLMMKKQYLGKENGVLEIAFYCYLFLGECN